MRSPTGWFLLLSRKQKSVNSCLVEWLANHTNRAASFSEISLPMFSEAVAAGEGALQMFKIFSVSYFPNLLTRNDDKITIFQEDIEHSEIWENVLRFFRHVAESELKLHCQEPSRGHLVAIEKEENKNDTDKTVLGHNGPQLDEICLFLYSNFWNVFTLWFWRSRQSRTWIWSRRSRREIGVLAVRGAGQLRLSSHSTELHIICKLGMIWGRGSIKSTH